MKKTTFETTTNTTANTNDITELVFILDRSGSMGGLESDTIGGFNSLLEKQKKEEGRAYVSTVLFDHETQVLHDRLPVEWVKPLTCHDYTVRGCTALLDAIGDAVHHIANIHKYARREDVPAHTMFVIITDGMENASKRYSGRDIKKLIEKEQEKYGWEFLFIGANIDAIATARSYGIAQRNAVNYHTDAKGTSVVYEAVSEAVSNMRCNAPMSLCWNRKNNEDFKSRKRRR